VQNFPAFTRREQKFDTPGRKSASFINGPLIQRHFSDIMRCVAICNIYIIMKAHMLQRQDN